jgi:beta-lactamase regulating signal transducer with metallopeptidase domain
MTGFETFAGLFAERALNCVPEGLLIAAVVWLGLRISRQQSAGTKFAVWFLTLAAITALPFIPALSYAAHDHVPSARISLSSAWAVAILVAWLAIVFVAGLRLAIGLWKVNRLRATCTPIDSNHFSALRFTIEEFRKTRQVEVGTSSTVRTPTAIGFLKPMIVLPHWALELPEGDLRAVVLHEFAHLRRRDDWTNLAQKILRAIFFFHPAVWWIEKNLTLEREMACDELVLAETGNRQAYARCLVSLAEKSLLLRGLALAQAAIGRTRETAQRLERILDTAQPMKSGVPRPALAATSAIALVAIGIFFGTPKLVVFQPLGKAPLISAVKVSQSAPRPEQVAQVIAKQMNQTVASKVVRTKTPPVERERNSIESARVVPAKAKPRRGPDLLRSAAFWPAPQQQRFFVVVQTTQFAGTEFPIMKFCVWRVTFDSSDGRAVRAEIIAKSI